MEILLSELHLSRVKSAYPRDLILLVNNSRRLPLCLRQDYVDEVLQRREQKSILRKDIAI